MGDRYLADNSSIPEEKLGSADTFLEERVAAALKGARNIEKRFREIRDLLAKSPLPGIARIVSLDRAYNDAIARRNFAVALREVEPAELGVWLGHRLAADDILKLAALHKRSKKYRRPIEQLLRACRCDEAVDQLSNGEYFHWKL